MELTDAARKLLLVDRITNRLELYDRERDEVEFEKISRYRISVGAEGYQTPRGVYVIHSKAKDPDWTIPASRWAIDAGLTPGTVVPGGTPENPLKERWLGVTDPKDGVGIHGTADIADLGGPASHGCIRMAPENVIELFELVPKGTPVVIV